MREVQEEDGNERPAEGDDEKWSSSYEGYLLRMRHHGTKLLKRKEVTQSASQSLSRCKDKSSTTIEG